MGEEQKATTGAGEPAEPQPDPAQEPRQGATRARREESAQETPSGPGYRRLARDPERRLLAGVCTGLGRYTGIDPVVYRVGFAVLVLAHGQGIILYVAAALLMPARPGGSSVAEQVLRRWFDASAVLTILGALLALGVVGSVFGGVTTDAVAIVVVFGLVLLVSHARGVDLLSVARTVPERLAGHPPEPSAARSAHASSASTSPGGVSLGKDGPGGLPEGMIDLAAYGTAWSASVKTAETDASAARYAGKTDTVRRERPGSPVASITLLAAMAAGAAMIPLARTHPTPDAWMLVMAPALAVIGLGLVLGGWFRTRGLAAAGTVLTLALVTSTAAAEIPRDSRFGEVEWRPTDVGSAQQQYRVAFGQGTLDLTALPLAAGQSVSIEAGVTVGGLVVRLPRDARVRLDARIGLGDLRIELRTTSGPNAKAVQVLEPETPVKNPPEIVLRIRGRLGDVDVKRV
ncbi:PspC domain-containing protein [Actinomadura fibrosa]|uniref:PspC domain-containing protein n=1 Tax=Actinomadura fibrosa TaxID=111802 RepID=A0ABW2XIT7_9ACTN|nr:PspC domain-containing protein [Actinomadura fibrosa]